MNGAALAASLVERGLDPSAAPAKQRLFDLVLRALAEIAPDRPVHAWWVPGRLEVFGKHTDYAGGRTLVCAVPRGVAVVASPRRDSHIDVLDAGRGARMILREPGETIFGGWRHYVEVVARRLTRNFPDARFGADIVFASDLPRASGMSSSSALVVAMSAALAQIGGIEERREWRANIRDTLDAAGYFACIENGLTFGSLAGDAGVGTHGGSEDHAAILASSPHMLSAFAFVPMSAIGTVRVPDAWRFVLAPSVVKSSKTGAAQGRYNNLARGAEVLLELWNATGRRSGSLGAALASTADGSDRLHGLVRQSAHPEWSREALTSRLDHFIREDARVPEALAAFHTADAASLGALSAASQADAETLLGNQIPETIALARSAREMGAFAASSFGAGFGGSVWALVDRDATQFAARWHPGAFVARPGPPLTKL